MYSEWAALQLENDRASQKSVLHSFPESAGRAVVGTVVRHLASELAHGRGSSGGGGSESKSPSLRSDADLKWSMEVQDTKKGKIEANCNPGFFSDAISLLVADELEPS